MNGNRPINHEFEHKIYEFFDYKWTHDRLLAIDKEEEKSILVQMPEFV